MPKPEVSSAFWCLSHAPVHEGRSRLGCYSGILTSYPIHGAQLLSTSLRYIQREKWSSRKKVGQDYCLSSLTPFLGLEVGLWKGQLGHLEYDNEYIPRNIQKKPIA